MEKNKEIDPGLESPIEQEGIAFSLNAKLFALNAAFEAARAGDAGAEFARLVHEWQATSMLANKTRKETEPSTP